LLKRNYRNVFELWRGGREDNEWLQKESIKMVIAFASDSDKYRWRS
jgi:hypothetical protein